MACAKSERKTLEAVRTFGSNCMCCALLVLPLALSGVGCTVAAEATARSGVTGYVSVSNSCPGPQKINQAPCTSVLPDAKLVLRKASGAVVSRTAAAADGSYTFYALAGSYVVQVEIEGMYPRCPAVELNIAKGQMAKADVICDSGMR